MAITKTFLFIFTFTLLAACVSNEPKLDAARSQGGSDVRAYQLLDRDGLGNVIVPNDCISWFDGCNDCGRMSDGSGAICTKKACVGEPQRAYCKKQVK